MKKKKKRRRSKGKKVSLPNDVAPTTHCDDDNCYTIGAIHTTNDESDYAYNMKRPKLGDGMFDENDMFENLFAAINVCPKIEDAIMKMIFLIPQVLICKFIMMIACLQFMMVILMKVGLEECQL